jgi:dsDNA-specific endonuclease/ATPase MutS2
MSNERKLRKLEDELADEKHWLGLWGRHFGTEPSRVRKSEEKIAELERKIAELKGEPKSSLEDDVWEVANDLRILRQHLGHEDLLESELAFDRVRAALGV